MNTSNISELLIKLSENPTNLDKMIIENTLTKREKKLIMEGNEKQLIAYLSKEMCKNTSASKAQGGGGDGDNILIN